MDKKNLLTTEEAMKLLKMSRGTFFARLREYHIKPANHNPNLRKQPHPLYRREDVAKLGTITDDEDVPSHVA